MRVKGEVWLSREDECRGEDVGRGGRNRGSFEDLCEWEVQSVCRCSDAEVF